MSFKEIKPTENLAEKEHQILSFWQEKKIFEKRSRKNHGKKRWSFLDGPLTANNPMGVHHAWGRTYKDLFQRYKAMQGFDERYQNGFDCQGLWVEVEVEKELGFKTKKDIEKYGIEKFVNKCKERVLKYSKIQTKQSIRLGQWMDWENSYYTMSDENNYAIWHFLKECFKKGYLYKGRDSVPWCPRCGTAISQHEILTEEYQEITHEAVYFKLPVGDKPKTSFLVWTTTPWTIPANVALAINPELKYGLFKNNQESLILLISLAPKILDPSFRLVKELRGRELLGWRYRGPFDGLERVKKAQEERPETFHQVVSAKELVTADEGTGIVHLAPGAGSEDYKLGIKFNLPVIEVINEEGFYLAGMGQFSGKNVKENPEILLDYLKSYENGRYFFKTENYRHRYPFCWRCKTELVWRVVDEWYISMKELRQSLMAITKNIKWLPSFGLERELDWLKNMQDWLISKKRYWGLALPIYECQNGHFEVIGSKEELKTRAIEGWEQFENHSPHRPWIDKVKIKCSECGKKASRIPDVGNPWLDAGIVPFSTLKYFEDKSFWEDWYPADFICESFPGQFKNWFYCLIAMSSVLEDSRPFKNVLGYALVRDEKGEEMHKSKGNAIWFDEAAEIMGVDVMRWLFATANPYENLNFSYKAGEEIYRRFILIFKNVYSFFVTYANIDQWKVKNIKSLHILDRWIMSRLNKVISEVSENLDKFQPQPASKIIESFVVEDLSTWYLRRSRKRRGKEFYSTFYQVLMEITKILAPFTPFLAEEIFQNLRQEGEPESVHLCEYPQAGEIDERLLDEMAKIRKIAETGHAIRAEKGIRLRQPLAKIKIPQKLKEELKEILKDELNVLEVAQGKEIELETTITPELQEKGRLRDIIRLIQDFRKKAGLEAGEKVSLFYQGDQKLEKIMEKFKDEIEKNTNTELMNSRQEVAESGDYTIDSQEIWLGIAKK